MGLGEIISGGTGGAYQVKLKYAYRDRIQKRLDEYAKNLEAIDAIINDPKTKPDRLPILRLQRAALQRLWDYYNNGMPADPTVAAWCADLTEDLAGNVGTIEIPGEPTTILVRPGYNSRAVYSGARDGQLMPAIAGAPNQVLFNWMLLPGWQRHKPTYRSGTIVSIDYDAHTATVCLDLAFSSQQSLPANDGINISDCDNTNPVSRQTEDFCERYPSHPFCTNETEGGEINLSDDQLRQLQYVNETINNSYGRKSDPSGVKLGDSWDVLEPGGSGDCEDFALTKMKVLVEDYGWRARDLVLISCVHRASGEYHMMLGVRTSNRSLLALDMNNDYVTRADHLGYEIDLIGTTRTSWKGYTRQLVAVPVEYMQCNSLAFAAGDSVVVEFTGQSWATPKVIGFQTNPQSCTRDVIQYGTTDPTFVDYSVYYYTYATDSWVQRGDIPTPWQRYGMISSAWGNYHFLFGGVDASGRVAAIEDQAARFNFSSWSLRTDMPSAKAHADGFALNAKHYAVGGSEYPRGLYPYPDDGYPDDPPPPQNDDCFSSNYEFDDTLNSWATRLSHPLARYLSMSFSIGGYGYCFGGSQRGLFDWINDGPLTLPDSVYRYDQAGDTWQARQDMRRGKWFATAGNINGTGYVFPGYAETAESGDSSQPYGYASSWTEKYNATLDVWALGPQAPSYQFASCGCAEAGLSGITTDGAHYVEMQQATETFRALAWPTGRLSSSLGMPMEAV